MRTRTIRHIPTRINAPLTALVVVVHLAALIALPAARSVQDAVLIGAMARAG